MNKLINTNLSDEQLEFANWLIHEEFELRQVHVYREKPQLLLFIWPDRIHEFKDLIEGIDPDYFTDGVLSLEYNGEDLIIDILPILKYNLNDIDPQLIYEDWSADEQ